MTQAATLQTLIQGILPEKTHHKNFRSTKHWISQELQINQKYLSQKSKLCSNTSSLHTPPNLALTQPTSPLNNKDPPFIAKSNFICLMGASPNLKPPSPLYVIAVAYFMVFNTMFQPTLL